MIRFFLDVILTHLGFCSNKSKIWESSEEDQVNIIFSMFLELPSSWVNKHSLNFLSTKIEAYATNSLKFSQNKNQINKKISIPCPKILQLHSSPS